MLSPTKQIKDKERKQLMILADKLIRLRKQFGLSQEELAEKMNVSRQSVSKWESANSIPDLNKILKLGEIFGVSTDYLLKDDIEETETISVDDELSIKKITLEEAISYIDQKHAAAKTTTIGVLFVLGSVIQLIFLLALSNFSQPVISSSMAVALGMVLLFIFIGIGVIFFIRSNQYSNDFIRFEEEDIELVYGVRSILKEKLNKYKSTYMIRTSIGIMLFITSAAPLILTAVLRSSNQTLLLMLVMLFIMIAAGIFIIIPSSTKHTAYNLLLSEGDFAPSRRPTTKRIEGIASVYWPLVVAIYLGWSFWTMAWHITWIVWPVASVLFAAIIGLSNIIGKRDH